MSGLANLVTGWGKQLVLEYLKVRRAKFSKFYKFSTFASNGKAMMSEAIHRCPWSQEDWLGDNSALFPLLFPNFSVLLFKTESVLGPEPWHQNVFKCSHSIHPCLKDLGDQGHRTGGPLDNEPPCARTSHLYLFIMCKFILALRLNYMAPNDDSMQGWYSCFVV